MTKEKEFNELHLDIVRAVFNVARTHKEGLFSTSVVEKVKSLFPQARKKDFKISFNFLKQSAK